eukprot:gnl/TRDRNA2_/TRDRNA2_56251_c0_seq2.p1 gnl/TRDRNA2_/TRDRNA2_56251_c0~~gnl/TRDRNA2_/TRDRNA2_56251_c0_seq2.p1  ORF type:complete len:182 (-),score=14.23 gnl/TRDRNA2_/TRDRNA2_56251_c0_seq2:142-687(-)
MGNSSSLPSGEAWFVQKPECCARCSFQEPKPASLSFISESAWSEFQSKVSQEASALWSSPEVGLILALPVLLLVPVMPMITSADGPLRGLPMILFGFIGVAIQFALVSMNQKHDEVISQAARDFAKHLGGGSLQYFTEYTGFCKPKGAMPTRALIYNAAQGQFGAQVVQAQVVGVVQAAHV